MRLRGFRRARRLGAGRSLERRRLGGGCGFAGDDQCAGAARRCGGGRRLLGCRGWGTGRRRGNRESGRTDLFWRRGGRRKRNQRGGGWACGGGGGFLGGGGGGGRGEL